jgi:hypothetical protein
MEIQAAISPSISSQLLGKISVSVRHFAIDTALLSICQTTKNSRSYDVGKVVDIAKPVKYRHP